MNFNYCNKAHTPFIKGGGMKKKRCWKIIIFISDFKRKRENIWNKKCPVGVKGHGVSLLFQRRSFSWQIFPSKRDQDLQRWDQCKNEAEMFVWEPWDPLSVLVKGCFRKIHRLYCQLTTDWSKLPFSRWELKILTDSAPWRRIFENNDQRYLSSAPPPPPNTIKTANEGRFRLNVDSPYGERAQSTRYSRLQLRLFRVPVFQYTLGWSKTPDDHPEVYRGPDPREQS